MRVSVRLAPNTRVSLGPIALLLLSPFIVTWYAGVLLIWLMLLVVKAISRSGAADMRWLATLVLAMSLAACGSSGHSAAVKAKSSPRYADPKCPVVLGVIPANPPSSQDEAAQLSSALSVDQGIGNQLKQGSLLRSLAFTVGADALRLSFDMGGLGGDTSGDLQTYNSDVSQLRQYCHA